MAGALLLRGLAALGAEQVLVAEETKPFVLATPVASFHNATLQVYAQVFRDLGHEVQTVTNIEHHLMYPNNFTGANGNSVTIDMVVSSDLPNNHAPWLANYTDSYNVVGTCYQLLQIYLAAPGYTGFKSLKDVKDSKEVNKTLIGFDINPCARCPDLAATWIKDYLGEGFTYQAYSLDDLPAVLDQKLKAKEVFATTWWSPTYWDALYPQIQKLDMGQFTKSLFNQGKALISTASPLITDPKYARLVRALSAVFIGSEQVAQMDLDIHNMGKEAHNAPFIVAQKWIKDNRKTYEMFFW